ncbi:MAG: hypothetical protein KGY54_05595 [Oleiphilaceae bacterium]|nr:hypothetical protein [Oleiphilaceae bacterium]
MKRFLITLAVVALLAYGSFKGGSWLLADSRFAMARDAVAPAGVLRRGAISTAITGELILKQVYYQPHEFIQPFHAERLRYITDSSLTLITSLVSPDTLPGQWQLRAEGLGIALDEAMAKNWVTLRTLNAATLFAPVCGRGDRPYLGMDDMAKMGVTALEGDAILSQAPDKLHFELNTSAAGSLELDWPGARLDPTRPLALPETTAEPLAVVVRDAGLMRKLSAYCARESGMDLADWTAAVTDAFDRTLATWGYRPSSQMRALLRRWLRDGGMLEVRLQPQAPMLGLPVHDDENAASDESTLDVRYNQSRVPGLYLTALTPAPADQPVAASPENEPSGTPAWHSGQVTESQRWLGRQVRVTLSNGKTLEGRLTDVSEKRLTIARSMKGGEVTYPIVLDVIERFEVWRRPSDVGRPLPAPDADSAELP